MCMCSNFTLLLSNFCW